jgi:mercuric ion binding protein
METPDDEVSCLCGLRRRRHCLAGYVCGGEDHHLAVKNMYCADCPFIVKKSLEGVPGVAKVTVSYKDKTATVTYDDIKADVRGLTAATTNAGYPSAPKS